MGDVSSGPADENGCGSGEVIGWWLPAWETSEKGAKRGLVESYYGMEEVMDSPGPGVTEVHGILLAMRKNLECPICLEVMKEPVSTHCAHVFCRFCILKLLEQKKGLRKTKCPLCNTNITRRTLREDVQFKLVIEGIREAFGALECDTGFNFLGDQSLHSKAMDTVPAAVLQGKQTIIESKGYRDRLNGAKEGEKRNRALQGKSSNLSLPNRAVTRCSLRKKSDSNKNVCFEIGSDSSEDPFQKTDMVRCLRSSSHSQDGVRRAEKRSRSPCHMELQKLSAEDMVLFGTPGACGLSEARAGSTEGLRASRSSGNAAVGKRQALSLPVPCMERHSGQLVSSSTQEGACSSLLNMEPYQLAGEGTDSAANKQASNKAETVSIMQPAGSVKICNLMCEDQQELTQPQAVPNSPLSQVSGKKLKQSIEKVNEWFSKSKILSPITLPDAHTEEGDPDLSPHLLDVDSHVSQKTELMEEQWEVSAESEVGRALSKPIASKMVDKIFGRTYKRARKRNPIWDERDVIHFPADESCSAMNTKSCDISIRNISASHKATLELSSEDIMKKRTVTEDSEEPVGDVNAVLEEDCHNHAVMDETPGVEQRAAELPVKEVASSCELDASPESCHLYSLQNLKKTRDSLSKRSRRPVRQVCALQLAVCGSSGSPDKTQAQAHSDPSREGLREASTEEMCIRRSKRLMSRAEGEQRGGEPAEKRRKQLVEGDMKQKVSQAENASMSVAEEGPSVLQDRQTGMAGDASKTCAFPNGKGSLNVEHPTENSRPCHVVPDTSSQGSCSLLQGHLVELEQTDYRDKEFTVAPQTKQGALCVQAPEGNGFHLGSVKESCKTPTAIENGELNPGPEDSELDAGFVWKIFRCCKRQSFLLHPAEESAAGTQMDLSVGQVEGSKADSVYKSNPGIDRVSEETREAVTGKVANCNPGLSLMSHAFPSSGHRSGSEHLLVAPQALFPDSSCMPVAANGAKSGNPLCSQKPGSDKRESLEMEKTTNANSCSHRTSGHWRSSNFLGTSLQPTDEMGSMVAHFLEMKPNSSENKALTCSSCPELVQPLPVDCQSCPSESSSGSVDKKSGVGEQKRLKGTGEQTVQMLSTSVSGGHLEQSLKDKTPGFPLLSDTPEGLLGPGTESKGCSLNLWEGDRQDFLAVFAKADPVSPHARDLECSSSSSGSRLEGLVQARRRWVQKLSSSSEEDSSEDDELPCFQALVFGQSASTPLPPMREEEEAISAEILGQKSSRQSSPRSQREGGSPSQESEGSVNLFSSQSCASLGSTGKLCDARPLTPVPTSQGKVVTPRTVSELLGEISRDAEQLRDGHQDSVNAAPNLGEALGYDSEVSHLGDSSGFSSQSEILTTQQKETMQNNLKKLQQEMAVIEAVLKEEGQGAATEGLPLPSEESVFAGRQTCSTKGSATNLQCGSKQSILSASPTAGKMCRTPDDYSTSSSTSQEHAAEPERDSPIAIQDKLNVPEQESQGRPISSFATTTICSSKKGNPKSLLSTSKRSMSLVASGLFPDELRLVLKFAKKTKSTWSNTISNDTTHVVMKTDEDLVCERTLKYFLGIAARKWVVSYQWVLQSLKEGSVLNEGDFEVRGDIINGRNHQGPKRARESSAGKLFQGFKICCYGPFTDMQREQLEWMVELCGGSLVKQPHLLRSTNSANAVVVIQPDAWEEDTSCQGIRLPCNATVVAREWVLDSVSCYQCMAFDEYVLQQV